LSQAVVLDTNVLVSAWHKPKSALSANVEAAVLRKMPIHVCPAIVAEYQDVLSRPKFERLGPWKPWLERLLMVAFGNPDPAPWQHPGPDPDDLVFLALAKATGAVLVTGNLADFPDAIREGVLVLTPGEYLNRG
jgi:putative PIN family toxin of toxin-antitoxin system